MIDLLPGVVQVRQNHVVVLETFGKFDKILDYLLLEYGEESTKIFVKKVYNFLEVLSEFPEIGTIENREKGIRSFTIIEQINVFYRIENEKIIILTFFDISQPHLAIKNLKYTHYKN